MRFIYHSFLFFTAAFALSFSQYPYNRPEITDFVSAISSSVDLSEKFSSADNYTILAPTNDALKIWLANNYSTDLVNGMYSYHLLQGIHSSSSLKNGTQLLISSLTDQSVCNVTGGQRVESLSVDGNVVFESWLKNTSRIASPDLLADGGIVHIVDTVLEVPSGVFDTLPRTNLSYAVEIISNANFVSSQNFAFAQNIGITPNVTFFLPNSAAAVANFKTAGRNQSDLNRQLAYHCVEQLLYAEDFANGTELRTLAGVPLTMTRDEDGSVYVNSAKITEYDYLVDNGVMHVIDDILDPNNITHHTPSVTSSTSGPTSTASGTSTPSSQSGLSTGAKIGIGIGAGILVVTLLIGVLIFFRRRKNSRQDNGLRGNEKAELHGNHKAPDQGHAWSPIEMTGSPVDEMPQLETNETPVEMYADVPKWK